MTTYRFHWKGGTVVEELEGDTPADALKKAGYGAGAVAALNYWEEIRSDGEATEE